MDDAEVDRVFAGKVWGAWYLSEAAAEHAAGLLRAHLVDRRGVGHQDAKSSTPRPTRSSTGWHGGCVSAASPASASTSASGRREWAIGRRGNNWTCLGSGRCPPADALAGMAELIDVVGTTRNGGPDRLDPLRCRFQQLQRKRSLLANIERELPETAVARDGVDRHTAVDRRAQGRPRPAAQAAGTGVPPQRRRGGDADRCRRRSATTRGFSISAWIR